MKNPTFQSKNKRFKIGITLGDPAGIGSEVVIKSLSIFKIPPNVRILLIGDSILVSELDKKISIPVYASVDRWESEDTKLGLLDMEMLKREEPIRYGEELVEYGRVSYSYLKKAIDLIKQSKIDRLITAPVNKHVINLTGIRFTGHTEFLAHNFNIDEVVMMLLSDSFKIVLFTRHVSLKKVAGCITEEKLKSMIKIVHTQIGRIFGLDDVRIGMTGINPHLGDNGLIGKEEKDIIIPTVKKLRNHYNIKGPLPIDRLIKDMKEDKLDTVICMYHDQGLVPLKLLYPNRGVNLTLGLPFIRTSPVHGTAYNIAGRNIAFPDSMLETLKFTTAICPLSSPPVGTNRGK